MRSPIARVNAKRTDRPHLATARGEMLQPSLRDEVEEGGSRHQDDRPAKIPGSSSLAQIPGSWSR